MDYSETVKSGLTFRTTYLLLQFDQAVQTLIALFSFSEWPLYSQGKSYSCLSNRRQEARRRNLDALQKEEIFRRCQESNNGSSVLESVMQSSSR